MFIVYVLKSESYDRFYIGMTMDLDRRLYEHNFGKTKSIRFYRPWKVFYFETFETRREAREREKFLKSGYGREFIKTLAP
jgi:putative endonuclease